MNFFRIFGGDLYLRKIFKLFEISKTSRHHPIESFADFEKFEDFSEAHIDSKNFEKVQRIVILLHNNFFFKFTEIYVYFINENKFDVIHEFFQNFWENFGDLTFK